jgi:methionyl-tRNA formyltransferase
MLLSGETPIQPGDTAGTLTARLAGIGAGLLVRTLDGLFDGTARAVPQDHVRATVTKKIRKAHGAIDWSRDAAEVWRRVRAMTPWPSAYTGHRGRRIIIVECAVAPPGVAAEPGTVLGVDPLVVACGTGALEIHRLRPEGRRAMTPAEYRAGNALEKGDRLGAGAD